MEKLDSMKTLSRIVIFLVLLSTMIMGALFLNMLNTVQIYRSDVYEEKMKGYLEVIKHQLESYDTLMEVTALNPTIRDNLFREDVTASEIVTLRTKTKQIINSITYLLINQNYLDRFVFFCYLPSDGKFFAPLDSMKNQIWYEEFLESDQQEFYTFVSDSTDSEHYYISVKAINDFNLTNSRLSRQQECYEELRINVKDFFSTQTMEDGEITSYPFLFYDSLEDPLVYSSNTELQQDAREIYERFSSDSSKMGEYHSRHYYVEEIHSINAHLIVLYEEVKLTQSFSRNGTILVILILVGVLIVSLFLLVVFNRNYNRRIQSVLALLDNFDENTALVSFSQEQRNDEIGKIQSHTIQMQNRIKTLIEEEYKIKLENISAQYQALSTNVNPHFLYNTLNSIAITSKMEGADDSTEMIIALSDMFRYSADMSNSFVHLADEVKNIQDYLYIQEIRYNKNFISKIEISDELMLCEVPKLILQPIVENCFKHGFQNKTGNNAHPNEIIVSAVHDREYLKIYIMDNGKGMTAEDLQRVNKILKGEDPMKPRQSNELSTEIGLSNVNKRLKLLYNEACGVEVSCEQEKYTCVKLLLKYENGEGEFG